MATVILEFKADTKGLDDSVTALQKTGKVSAETAALFNKSEQEKQAAIKKTGETFQFTNKQAQDLANNFKNMQAKVAAQGLAEAAKKANDFNESVKRIVDTSLTLNKAIRSNTEELALLAAQGQKNTDKYRQLLDTTALLKQGLLETNKQIAATAGDTKGIEALVHLGRSAIGVFQLAKGAQFIFGEENKQLEKTLVRLTASMAALQGLQEIGNTLSAKSVLIRQVEIGQQQLKIAIDKLETYAESENTVVKWLAIEAQIALNAAMEANPILIVIGAITALSAALFIFADRGDKAREIQLAMNQATKDSIELNNEAAQAVIRHSDAVVTALEKERQQALRNGQDQKRVLELEGEILQAKLDAANQNAQDAIFDIEMLPRRIKLLDEVNQRIREYTTFVELTGRAVSKRATKQFEADKAEAEALKAQIKYGQDARDAKVKAEQDFLDLQNRSIKAQIQLEKDKFDTIVAQAFRLSQKKEAAEINSLRQSLELQLSVEGISEEKRKLLAAQTEKAIAELQAKYTQERIADQRKAIDAELQFAIQNSQTQLALRIQDLEKQRAQELAAYQVTDNEKLDIEAKFQKQRNDLVADYNLQVSLRELAAQKVTIQAKTVLEKEGNKQILNDSLALIQIEQNEALSKNENLYEKRKISFEEFQTELTRINGDALNKRFEAEKAFNAKEIQLQQDDINAYSTHEKAKLELVKTSLRSTGMARYQASQQQYDIEVQRINAEYALNEKAYTDKLKTDAQYLNDKERLEDEKRAAKQAKDNEAIQREIEIRTTVANSLTSIGINAVNAVFEIESNNRQADFDKQMKNLDKLREAELNNKNLTESQKNAITEKYAKKEAALRRKDFEAEKQAKIEQAVINGALAITNIIATRPKFDFGIGDALLIASSIAAVGAQIAVISSAKPPAFAKGTKSAPEGMALVGEEGPELVYLSGGSKVIPNKQSQAILDSYNIPTFSIPETPDFSFMRDYEGNTTITQPIDYDKLIKGIGEEIRSGTKPVINWDKNGASLHFIGANSKIETLNNYYRA